MAMRRRRRSRGVRPGYAGLVLFLLIVIVVAVVLNSRVFVVKTIEVVGYTSVPAQDIITISGLNEGQSIFRIDQEKVRKQFDSIGKIAFEGMEIRRPDSVKLLIRERTPRAIYNYAGMPTLIDEYGYAIEQSREMPSQVLPTVTGLRATTCQVGYKVTSDIAGQVDAMSAVLQQLYTRQLEGVISELNVADLDNMYLMVRSGTMVKIGDDTQLQDKMSWMIVGLNQLSAAGRTGETLDVSDGKSASWLNAIEQPPTTE
ncbi:FtsQ-type POTRA domain-containing protein [Eubacteriales bacterium OttesenSCG-928-N13]|nr:FtsQ-type POTRA domain-containing protein [Eubacteriales bacterium OttesenSCG-928-N13]